MLLKDIILIPIYFYFLYPFPTEKKNKDMRERWIKLINRVDEKRPHKLWIPSKDSRVCSNHFLGGAPTADNPIPCLYLGYDCKNKVNLFSPPTSRRRKVNTKAKTLNRTESMPQQTQETRELHSPLQTNTSSDTESTIPYEEESMLQDADDALGESEIDFRSQRDKMSTPIQSPQQNDMSTPTTKSCEVQTENTSYAKHLLNNKNVKTYTNFKTVEMFNSVHELIAPFVRWRYKSNTIVNNGTSTPKRRGPKRKLPSKDEFLLCLMKLRLGLITQDLADRFSISQSLVSAIFHCWIRAMAECLKSVIYIPELGTIKITSPKRYTKYKDLVTIIDCSEIFIETPKDPELQAATWSEYKHHNTIKFLVGVGPNSAINFISKAYTGRISDKEITNDSGILNRIPKYASIMAVKGFNIQNECTANSIYLIIPPGRRGQSQMSPSEIAKTSEIATDRIIVEQVIRRMKTFKIIAGEMPITMLPHADDILVAIAALSNFMEPIYED